MVCIGICALAAVQTADDLDQAGNTFIDGISFAMFLSSL
jgi:hypothetical protein